LKKILLFLIAALFSSEHLQFTRVVVKPDKAELISIFNPTTESISLAEYYISDSPDYYKIQTENNLSPGNFINDFLAKFPNIEIAAGDSLDIAIHPDYADIYLDNFVPDLLLQTDLQETEPGSLGAGGQGNSSYARLDNAQECLMLFKWDGNTNNPVQDIDYFLWGGVAQAVDKTDEAGYLEDTPANQQDYFSTIHDDYSSYFRLTFNEAEELNGNGYNGHDETSELFNSTWHILASPDVSTGCTDQVAMNYDPQAEFDDGSCLIGFQDIMSGQYTCQIDSRDACANGQALTSCPIVQIQGTLISFGDYTLNLGPYAFKLEDDDSYRLELTIWPSTWDLPNDPIQGYLTQPPFYDYLVRARGNVFEYNGNKQVYLCGPDDIEVIESYNVDGVFVSEEIIKASINPEPYVIIPTLGETLDYSYSFPSNSRVIIRLFDISGNFITSLEDKFFESSGTIHRIENSSAWDGRDHLGQIVNPGAYLMHLEVINFSDGNSQTDTAPVIVGVKN
tara:strand:+ start:7031 stop:8551 length:1521 start_codon:yes stop_codon:yes gene_type:complete